MMMMMIISSRGKDVCVTGHLSPPSSRASLRIQKANEWSVYIYANYVVEGVCDECKGRSSISVRTEADDTSWISALRVEVSIAGGESSFSSAYLSIALCSPRVYDECIGVRTCSQRLRSL